MRGMEHGRSFRASGERAWAVGDIDSDLMLSTMCDAELVLEITRNPAFSDNVFVQGKVDGSDEIEQEPWS